MSMRIEVQLRILTMEGMPVVESTRATISHRITQEQDSDESFVKEDLLDAGMRLEQEVGECGLDCTTQIAAMTGGINERMGS